MRLHFWVPILNRFGKLADDERNIIMPHLGGKKRPKGTKKGGKKKGK